MNVEINSKDEHKVFYVNNTDLPSEVEKIEERKFGSILDQTRDHLTASPNLFVNDGSVGYAYTYSDVRSICDNSNSALILSRMLHFSQIPLEYVYRVFNREGKDITREHRQGEFYKIIQKYAAEGKSVNDIESVEERRLVQRKLEEGLRYFESSPEINVKIGIPNDITTFVASNLNLSSSGLPSRFSVVDLVRGIVLVIGDVSSDRLLHTLLPTAAYKFQSQNILSLFSHCYSNIGSTGSTLLFDPNNLLASTSSLSEGLVGSHATFVHDGFYSPAFQGASLPISSQNSHRFDYLEKSGSSLRAVRKFDGSPQGNVSSIVFTVADSQGVLPPLSRLNRSQALQFFLLGYNGSSFNSLCSPFASLLQVDNQLNLFQQFLESNNVDNIYLLNSSSKSDISSLLTSVRDGSAQKASQNKVSHIFDCEEVVLSGSGQKAPTKAKVDALRKALDERKKQFPNFKW